jgi:uncharacterized surface protein with fasciclin (FAS1) repeats
MTETTTRRLNLIDTIAKQPGLAIFSQMLMASGIDDIFAQGGDFTIFAPTDRAFNKLPPRRLLALLYQHNRTDVKNLVLFHITPGRLMAEEPRRFGEVFPGKYLIVAELPVYIGEPKIRVRNIQATNGVVHEIGNVLSPACHLALVH